jgi:tRNA(fMet)-specific endonuclease VapC
MIILDTDHFTILGITDDPRYSLLTERLLAAQDERIVTTVVTVEEQLRGWLAVINRWRDLHKQLPAYSRFGRLLEFLRGWEILPLDERVADTFDSLRGQRIRIGSQDLKIAAIALVHGALLLTGNSRDFRRVPDLNIEDWTKRT